MGKILEITAELETFGDKLNDPSLVAILNLPGTNLCEKRDEKVENEEGKLELACKGCITEKIRLNQRMSFEDISEVIHFFHSNYNTRILTINGRGDPFHPEVLHETLFKIRLGRELGIISYVFTGGNNLDDVLCSELAKKGVNIMMSLHGNRFIDKNFFDSEFIYPVTTNQDQSRIATNYRRLISHYLKSNNQPTNGTTRLGMNYVIQPSDTLNEAKVMELKEAAEANGIFFVCNVPFEKHPDDIQQKLRSMATKYSTRPHSTFVQGQCQMGAGSSVTVDCGNLGALYRCPYQFGKGDGNFISLSDSERKVIVQDYLENQRSYNCVMRKTPREFG